jgi:thioredoxin-dependent peroxiredoxin
MSQALFLSVRIRGVVMSRRTFIHLSILTSMLLSHVTLALATPPEVGKPAPDFKLLNQDGKSIKLRDYRGQWVVLYFYPKDFTSGCTIEARNFQKDLPSYEKLNAVILGVSVDDVDSHKNFCAKEGLNFKLLADSDQKVSEMYDSLKEYNGKKLSARNTFIIDPKGKIAKIFLAVKPADHSSEILAALAELKQKK